MEEWLKIAANWGLAGVLVAALAYWRKDITDWWHAQTSMMLSLPQIAESLRAVKDTLVLLCALQGESEQCGKGYIIIAIEDDAATRRLLDSHLQPIAHEFHLQLLVVSDVHMVAKQLEHARILIWDLGTSHGADITIAAVAAALRKPVVVFTGRDEISSIPGVREVVHKPDYERLCKVVREAVADTTR